MIARAMVVQKSSTYLVTVPHTMLQQLHLLKWLKQYVRQKRILPSIAYLEGEYGYNDIYLGVPTFVGVNGIEKIFELALTDEEKAALDNSADAVKAVMKSMA
ncbi:Malate dehydrogenase [Lysinibacillus sphaericus]